MTKPDRYEIPDLTDVWYVEHTLGASLVRAKTEERVLRIVMNRYGTHGAPYKVTQDEDEIHSALAMGAYIL